MSDDESGVKATSALVESSRNTRQTQQEEEDDDDGPFNPSMMGFETDLVNGPNPWLPAYGFQIQHRFQPVQEDLRANETTLAQQVDFLETILEETSDDLQSDSDRSGTTYWLGSDSETESVIHIRISRHGTDDKPEGSGSEGKCAVPSKRRRRNDEREAINFEDFSSSPRSSRSSPAHSPCSDSSRSSSLLRFESLERTCATLSPSGYSFDSLEYTNRSNAFDRLGNTSPDSLEEESQNFVPNGGFPFSGDSFGRIRPYRSFEGLDSRRRDDDHLITNGLVSFLSKRNPDLSGGRRRNFWHEEEDEEYEDLEGLEADEGDPRGGLREFEEHFEERTFIFNDATSASLDCRNTIDLREIGIETRRDTLLELKTLSDSLSPRLNLVEEDSIEQQQHRRRRRHKHRQERQRHHHHHHHHHHRHEEQQQYSGSFNFRFAGKSRSAPSLPSELREYGQDRGLLEFTNSTSRTILSTWNLSENYTKVSSVPVDLNLCGYLNGDLPAASSLEGHVMADTPERSVTPESSYEEEEEEEEVVVVPSSREEMPSKALSSVRTQDSGILEKSAEVKRTNSTVKTQDRGDGVLREAVIAMENDVDAVVERLKRQFEETENRPRRVRNNASYELAQQFQVNERNVRMEPKPIESPPESPKTPGGSRKKILNNASYELAQQCDYIKTMQSRSKIIQRMDACDELEEPSSSSRSSRLRLTDHVRSDSPEVDRGYPKTRNNEEKEESLLTQIKKNSDPFSTLGEGGSILDDDEVDHSSCQQPRETHSSSEQGTNFQSTEGHEGAGNNNDDKNDEKSLEETRSENDKYDKETVVSTGKRITIECPRNAGEEKEKIIVEKENEGTREYGVHDVYPSPPIGNTSNSSSSLESSIHSGNRTVPVDTNRRWYHNSEDSCKNHRSRDLPSECLPSKVHNESRKMDSPIPQNVKPMESTNPERKKSGFGGFLQRFSKLRFSGRSKVPRSEIQKKNEPRTNRAKSSSTDEQKAKEPDYIIIPLHPPPEERNQETKENDNFERNASDLGKSGRPPVSSKPPLPPQPPRVGSLGLRSTSTSSSSWTSSRRRAATDLGNPAAIEMAKSRTMQASQERPVGLLETDLDVAEGLPTTTTSTTTTCGKKTRSLLDLNHTSSSRPTDGHLSNDNALRVPQSPVGSGHRNSRVDEGSGIGQRPHKSMEFLLDKENLHFVKPPENELQKVGERVPSEHELRVQRSLQRLNVPDWYKNSPAARDGFRLKRHSDASQHGGWRALGSKTTSLSSLSSSSNRQPATGALLSPSPTPPVFSRWSTSLLNSAGSSPASSARSSFNHRQPYLGWRSQERLTNPRTPAERLAQGILPQLQQQNKQQQQQLEVRNSIKEVTSAIVHYVQSGQEIGGNGRLSPQPRPRPEDWDDRGGARSTSPRGSGKMCWMESSFVGSRPVDSPETPMSLATETDCCTGCNATGTESCSCVDSATCGLYLDLTPTRDEPQRQSSNSLCPSPSSSYHQHRQTQQRHHRGSGQSETDEMTTALLRNKPSPGSTTLEDVLDSLLGLPSASRTPSPGPGPISSSSLRHRSNLGPGNAKAGKSCSDLRQDLQESVKAEATAEDRVSYYMGELVRRKSEGSDSIPSRSGTRSTGVPNFRHRRVSFDNAQENGMQLPGEKIVRCRNNTCNNWTSLSEAKRSYKSCHNCTCLYCSRECRRAHWQRHRRTCLHSRAGTLCKQVLSSAKEDSTTLKHVSALAKRGYASHGRGAVKCFFSSPEAAEKFVGHGFVELGEPTYVRWSDLLPGEMGSELYAEVMRLCKSYNPDTRLVLYVAVCVVSEVPSSTSGAVKWERQLVSRCAKLRLDVSCRQPTTTSSSSASPQGRQRASSPCNITREMDSPETLVLTSLPGGNGQNTPKKAREITFTNIQRELRLRGVSLRRHFPQVYKKLCLYVEGSVDKFAPVTIYPRDQASGKSFMCIIMLDAEPERLRLLPTDSSRVRTVDISIEQE